MFSQGQAYDLKVASARQRIWMVNYLHSSFSNFQGRVDANQFCTNNFTSILMFFWDLGFIFPVGNFIAYQSDYMHKYVQWNKENLTEVEAQEVKVKKKKKKSLFVLYLQVQLQKRLIRLMDRQTAVRIKKLGVLQNFCSQIMYFFPQLKGNSNKRDLEQ